MKNHPDRNPGDKQAEERFKEAARAYEILSNPSRREAYDRFGTTGEPGSSGMGGMEDIFGGFGIDDALRAFMENFGFSTGGSSRNTLHGEDVTVKVDLDLQEAALGGRREIEVDRNTACEDCRGTGADSGAGRRRPAGTATEAEGYPPQGIPFWEASVRLKSAPSAVAPERSRRRCVPTAGERVLKGRSHPSPWTSLRGCPRVTT